MLIRHRKNVHKYQPYHTDAYLAKLASRKEKGRVVQAGSKAVSDKTRGRRTARTAPYTRSTATSSSVTLSNVPEKVAYHDDFWRTLVDIARFSATKPHDCQDVQVHLPVTTHPGYDTPSILQPASNSSFQGAVPAQFQPFTSEDMKLWDSSLVVNPQLDIPTQSQALALPSTQCDYTLSAVSSDYAHLADHTTNLTPFPTTFGSLTYPELVVPEHYNESLMGSYSNISSSTPSDINLETELPFYSTPELPLVPPNYGSGASSEPQPWPAWTNGPEPAMSTPLSHDNIFSPELDECFNAWYRSNCLF
jgi:hypothetical protein